MGLPWFPRGGSVGPPFSFRREREKPVAKRYDEAIEVDPDPIDADAPVAFRWRGRRYEIDQRLSSWREAWTAGRDGHKQREYYRVLARPSGASSDGNLDADGFLVQVGAVYDVYRDMTRGNWKLARVWD